MTPIERLAQQQLDAYNRADLNAFVACYHPEVRILNGKEESLAGIDDFRTRYQTLFKEWEFGASIPALANAVKATFLSVTRSETG